MEGEAEVVEVVQRDLLNTGILRVKLTWRIRRLKKMRRKGRRRLKIIKRVRVHEYLNGTDMLIIRKKRLHDLEL